MWFLLLLLYIAHVELVIAQDGNRLILKSEQKNNPCEGYIEITHKGEVGYVGDQTWDDKIEEVVCKSTHCGDRVGSAIQIMQNSIKNVWLNNLNCSKTSENLWSCKHPGWNKSDHYQGYLRTITCENEIKIGLDGPKCAGAANYSITAKGKTKSGYFCADNWDDTEANQLCKNLGCGESISNKPKLDSTVLTRFKDSDKMKVECNGIKQVNHLWQCVTGLSEQCRSPASVTCKEYKRLQLQGDNSNVCSGQLQEEEGLEWKNVTKNKISSDMCQNMHCGKQVYSSDNGILNCSDNVTVVLMDNNEPSKCYGKVYVKVNNKSHPVCASSWELKDAQVVCSALKCGKVVSKETRTERVKGIMDDVECSGKESSLWHCRARHEPPQCSSIAYVVCSDSVNVTLRDGLGKCAGRVEIQYEGKWQRVGEAGWTDTNSDIVCKQVGCGKNRKLATPEKFSQGSGEFLAKSINCQDDSNDIAECFKDTTIRQPQGAKGITCEGHRDIFLVGDKPCSGMVRIAEGEKNYWLSGSNETWTSDAANTVCQQMQCGTMKDHGTRKIKADKKKGPQIQSYKCSSNYSSLFECEEKPPLQYKSGDPIAFVKCTGEVKANLSNGCWGTVGFCVGAKFGGVCKDTWTPAKSDMLCRELGCGDKALKSISKPPESKVMFKSVHGTNKMANLTQCNFIINNDTDIECKPAYAVCSGSVVFKMDLSRDKCSGNVRVLYEDKLLPVCRKALENSKIQSIICQELGCGTADKLINYFGPKSQESHVISEINCPSANGSLKACEITPATPPDDCNPVGLQCSGWQKIELTGAGKACSGAVSVHSQQEQKRPVSRKGWGENEGKILCRDLNCGKYVIARNKTLSIPSLPSSPWTSHFNCNGTFENQQNIWTCEKPPPNEREVDQLIIECDGEPNITLSNYCQGEVRINGTKVCASHWKDINTKLVCQQKKCGNAIDGVPSVTKADRSVDYYNVKCEENHYELGQCKRYEEKCKGNLVSVSCVNGVNFNTTSYCGGQIEVNYQGVWEKVCFSQSFTQRFKEHLCNKLNCGTYNSSIKDAKDGPKDKWNITLECAEKTQDINYCVKYKSCEKTRAAEIYCEKYVRPAPIINNSFIVPIILGVGFFLVLVIVIVLLIRICIVKKTRRAKNASLRMFSRKEVEFESGDYEDVTSKANEMEDLNRSKFISESEVIMENGAQSSSSLSYDDIDGMLETHPLTSKAATAGASGDNVREAALNQSEDGVTYEVDDPLENYDDIEAGPEITQTEAEIHQSPQTAPESDTAPPPDLVEGDDDYLVPGQDG